MPCVFRIGGESLDIDSLLREITIRPLLSWRKGAARLPGGNKIATNSGANFDASNEFGLRFLAPGHCTGWRAMTALANAFPDALAPLAVGKQFTFSA